METNNNQFKMGQITVFVDGNIKEIKKKSGLTWRSLIIRGIKSLKNNEQTKTITEMQTKIAKMAEKLQSQAIKIHNLEKKE